MISLAILLGVGTIINDSGIVVPAVGILFLVPVLAHLETFRTPSSPAEATAATRLTSPRVRPRPMPRMRPVPRPRPMPRIRPVPRVPRIPGPRPHDRPPQTGPPVTVCPRPTHAGSATGHPSAEAAHPPEDPKTLRSRDRTRGRAGEATPRPVRTRTQRQVTPRRRPSSCGSR
ncbi:hypothetical protein IOD13_12245 [Brevibacterium casei]|nr:hypothetical protein [Brevibacterium casei]